MSCICEKYMNENRLCKEDNSLRDVIVDNQALSPSTFKLVFILDHGFHGTVVLVSSGQWFHFNDSTVTACEPDVVARCKAYILFYVRRQIRLPDYLVANGNGTSAPVENRTSAPSTSAKHK